MGVPPDFAPSSLEGGLRRVPIYTPADAPRRDPGQRPGPAPRHLCALHPGLGLHVVLPRGVRHAGRTPARGPGAAGGSALAAGPAHDRWSRLLATSGPGAGLRGGP